MRPETRYARSGEVNIAYQVAGEGPVDLVLVPGWVSHLDASWDDPLLSRFLERLASFSRLILFDKRGTGLSDRVPASELPTLEQRMDDVRAVMQAAGSSRAAILGVSEGGPMSVLFAATYPERVAALVMYGSYARWIRDADTPWAPTAEMHEAIAREIDTAGDGFLATFDGPARAVRAACAIGASVHRLGLDVRAGLHTGECEIIGPKLAGIAVHIGARIAALAGPGEVLVSGTVKDLVAGSGLRFSDRGTRELKGVPGPWQLYSIEKD